MAIGVEIEEADWLTEFESASAKSRQLMNKISERNRLQRYSSSHVRLTTEINRSMNIFASQVERLRNDLGKSSLSVTSREWQRRETMLDSLLSKEKQMQEALKTGISGTRHGDVALFETSASRRSDVVGWDDDDDTTALLTNEELKQEQKRIIREQDEGLDVLSQILSRQKNVGLTIGEEVDAQNEMLDDIHEGVEITRGRLVRETRNVQRVDRKDRTFWLWIVMVILLVAIIVVAVVPYKGKA